MSTHAKAASAPSERSSQKGSKVKQLVGVSGHTHKDSGKKGSSTNASVTNSKPLTSCVVNNTNINMELVTEKQSQDKNFVVVNNNDVTDSIDSDSDEESEVTAETEVDSENIDIDYESDEEDEYDEEVARILEDARKLKILAQAFLHPEKSVQIDPTAFARNYFTTPSIQPTESVEEANERAAILQDALELKKNAVRYLHPELPIEQSAEEKMLSSARNYFSRSSGPEQESFEEAEERTRILEDAAALKNHAVRYMHPEVGVKSTDATVFGRNYFNRPSAVEHETEEESKERAQIMADLKALKQAARDYLHPEIGVKTTDATVYGRNYFNRPSALDTEDDDFADERAEILAEAAALKKQAVAYMHPEIGVKTTDATVYGRNYFNRPSAPEVESHDTSEIRAQIIADASGLKKYAVDHMHPEIGVKTTDANAFGHNFFSPDKNAIYTESMETYVAPHDDSISEVEDYHGSMFDLDDHDDFSALRNSLRSFIPISTNIRINDDEENPIKQDGTKEDEEGNLSRSPSSVMLFGLEGSA